MIKSKNIAGLIALFAFADCNYQEGIVEINWTFVDQVGDRVIPSSRAEDSCAFTGNFAGQRKDYRMEVELRACFPDCEGGCTNPVCYAVDPFRFDCQNLRASSKLPAEPSGYEFQVAVIAVPEEQEQCECELSPSCIAIPGPRTRAVEAGLISDLQVYQLRLAITNQELAFSPEQRILFDIHECCIPSSACMTSLAKQSKSVEVAE